MRKPLKLAASLLALGAVVALWHALPQRDAVMRQLWGLNQAKYTEFSEKVKARKLPQVDARISYSLGDELPAAPAASPPGGLHGGPLTVTLAAPPGGRAGMPIHFTRDGSVPTRRDSLYRGPLRVDTNTVLRFRCLPADRLPGVIGTEAYLLADSVRLPILSLVTDPVNLWNKYSGIYENPLEVGRSWERQADLQYLRAGHPPVGLTGHLRIHGGYSRRVPKKSFRFRFPVTPGIPLPADHLLLRTAWEGENTVVIRAGGAAHGSRVRDALSALLYSRLGGLASDFDPVFLFLNGQPWGVYDLRERIELGWLRRRFGEGEYELMGFDSRNKTKWGTPVVGGKKHWEGTQRFFREHSLADSARFSQAAALVDPDNTVDYWIHNVYAANVDWPYNNFNAFRKTGLPAGHPDGRWRWISWDVDGSFDDQGKGLLHNTLEWSLRDRVRNDLKWNFEPGMYEDQEMYLKSTLVMRRFLEHAPLRARFAARTQDLLNTAYRPAPVLALLDSVLALTEAERARDFRRWGWSDSAFRVDMERVRTFIARRPDIVRGHLAARFGLGAPAEISLRTRGPGRVRLNALTPFASGAAADSAWTGTYLAGTEIALAALPDSGAVFAGWEGAGSVAAKAEGAAIVSPFDGPWALTAVFRSASRDQVTSR